MGGELRAPVNSYSAFMKIIKTAPLGSGCSLTGARLGRRMVLLQTRVLDSVACPLSVLSLPNGSP